MRGEPARCVRHSPNHASLPPLADRQRDILARLLSNRCCLLDLMPAAGDAGGAQKAYFQSRPPRYLKMSTSVAGLVRVAIGQSTMQWHACSSHP
jgi:hypothetical protein